MKNLNCNIISDLLPSYTDQKCKPFTAEAIENHLSQCENCKALFENMSVQLHTTPKEIPKTDIKKADKKVKLHYTKKTLIFACIAALIVFFLSCVIPFISSAIDSSSFIIIGAVFAYEVISLCVTMVVSFTRKYQFIIYAVLFIAIGLLPFYNMAGGLDTAFLSWFIVPPLIGAVAGKIAKR